MNEYLITTCSKNKDDAPGLLPAIERYQNSRIEWVYLESIRLNTPMLIFSGEFGLLEPIDPIPWYDHALQMDEISKLIPKIARKLRALGVESLRFYARPASEPGWRPYHAALKQACAEADVTLNWIPWRDKTL
ncbi:MAG: hypothetical protein ACOCYU_01425 [Brevefilum sp.]